MQASAPSAILNQFDQLRQGWFQQIWPYASTLFGLLATIEFSWAAAVMALEKSDMQSWVSALVRKIMWIGAFYTLLLFGPTWIPLIISSFVELGQRASGAGALTPGAVFVRGLDVAGVLWSASNKAGFLANTGMAFALVFAGIMICLSFVLISMQMVVAIVESYILTAAGVIFLGFGGSRWTAPFVERYLALAVSIGVKLFMLYLVIAGVLQFSGTWVTDALAVANHQNPSMAAWEIAGASIILACVSWEVPKFVSGLLGGAPALTGGDLLAMGTMVATAGSAAVAGAAAKATGLISGGSSSGSTPSGPSPSTSGGGSSSGSAVAAVAAPAGQVSPPQNGASAGTVNGEPISTPASDNAGVAAEVAGTSGGGGNLGGGNPAPSQPAASPIARMVRQGGGAPAVRPPSATRRIRFSGIPSDHGGAHASPPQMPINNHD